MKIDRTNQSKSGPSLTDESLTEQLNFFLESKQIQQFHAQRNNQISRYCKHFYWAVHATLA